MNKQTIDELIAKRDQAQQYAWHCDKALHDQLEFYGYELGDSANWPNHINEYASDRAYAHMRYLGLVDALAARGVQTYA